MKNLLIKIIRFYQRHISSHLPAQCRYYPTCSAYTITAINYYGAFKGSLMGLLRVLRCNPLFPGGYDPVPVPKNWKEKDEQSTNTK